MKTEVLLPDAGMMKIIEQAIRALDARAAAPAAEPAPTVIKLKKCSDCKTILPLSSFYRDAKIRRDGRKNLCKACWAVKYGPKR